MTDIESILKKYYGKQQYYENLPIFLCMATLFNELLATDMLKRTDFLINRQTTSINKAQQLRDRSEFVFYRVLRFAQKEKNSLIECDRDSNFTFFICNLLKRSVFNEWIYDFNVTDEINSVLKTKDIDEITLENGNIRLRPSEMYFLIRFFISTYNDILASDFFQEFFEIVFADANNFMSLQQKKMRERRENNGDNQKNVKKEASRNANWRNAVLKRDNHTCQCCGYDKLKNLEAHHIYGFRDNPEYADRVDNGITLCKFCHKKYHSDFGRDGANPHDLILFFNKYGVRFP